MSEKEKNIASEPQADYEKAEIDLLRDALKRSYKERVLFLSKLIAVQNIMQRAKITHQPSFKL